MSTGNLGLVHITEYGGDTKSYPINGEGITPRQVIADFLGVDLYAVESLLAEQSFKIINRGVLQVNGLDRSMEHGETITVTPSAVATGKFPGAAGVN